MRHENEVNSAIENYSDMLRRICFINLKNHHDVEDIFQDVFLKYALSETEFTDSNHEKAWVIRVAINSCKDLKKSFFRRKVGSINEEIFSPFSLDESDRDVLGAVLRLPHKYMIVIYLFYYEGYSAVEIAEMLEKNENTVYTWLARARKMLEGELRGDILE